MLKHFAKKLTRELVSFFEVAKSWCSSLDRFTPFTKVAPRILALALTAFLAVSVATFSAVVIFCQSSVQKIDSNKLNSSNDEQFSQLEEDAQKINQVVDRDYFATLPFNLNLNLEKSGLSLKVLQADDLASSQENQTSENAQHPQSNSNGTVVSLNQANIFIPTSEAIESYITQFLDKNAVTLNDEQQNNIKVFASNVVLRYTGFAGQYVSAERAAVHSYEQLRNLCLTFLVVLGVALIFTLALIWRFRHTKRVLLVSGSFGGVALVALISFLLTSTNIAPNFFPISYALDLEQGKLDPIDINSSYTNLIAKPVEPDYGSIFAHIDIDSQDIHYDIVQGDSDKNLHDHISHYQPSVLMGEMGVSVIDGHNYTDGSIGYEHFGKIHDMQIGDLFTVTTGWGKFTYKVVSSTIEDTAAGYTILNPMKDYSSRKLLLYSCYPLYSASTPLRAVVTAEQIDGPLVVQNNQ